ncbi:MAG: hypothetical protein KA715_11400 [Xanthomonadaceae bacterium]|nr:hypothetical protein [Xanthomonadaceae bacterium]
MKKLILTIGLLVSSSVFAQQKDVLKELDLQGLLCNQEKLTLQDAVDEKASQLANVALEGCIEKAKQAISDNCETSINQIIRDRLVCTKEAEELKFELFYVRTMNRAAHKNLIDNSRADAASKNLDECLLKVSKACS